MRPRVTCHLTEHKGSARQTFPAQPQMVSPLSSLSLAALVFLQAARVVAQLPLPSSQWLPPTADFGAIPSSGNSTPNPHWSTILGEGLYFYEAQRSGRLPDTNRVSWRNDSCINDGQDVNLDLSGGYYDAGSAYQFFLPRTYLILRRFHQVYTPTRRLAVDWDQVTTLKPSCRASPSCKSVGEQSITEAVVLFIHSIVTEPLNFALRIRHF